MYKKIIALTIMFYISSCATNQRSGATIGAISGGIIGTSLSRGGSFGGIAIGSVLGGIAGSTIGRTLDENDKKIMEQTTYNALEKKKTML